MPVRSKKLIEVGYYLSRFGISNPPSQFGDAKWSEVYRLFYDSLGQGREVLEFEHSLKNTRDGFDGYFPETKREGWKDKDGNPAKLPADAQIVFNQFQNLDEEEIYDRIKVYISNVSSNKESIEYEFNLQTKEVNLFFKDTLTSRFTSSLLTKPFVILTGLSGSGKTKLAQAFAMWMSENKEQYALVPVGADWTNREPLLGYPNSLKANHYVKPDTGVLDILLRAHEDYMANEKDLAKCTPFFLILDEMNLSHVERYFADFLSTMESGDEIKLYSGSQRYAKLDADDNAILGTEIPDKIILPKNLFIIGTVNIDETTYMFSPKVLDRANTIEFRITPEEMETFYKNTEPLDMDALKTQGKEQAPAFMALASGKDLTIDRSKHKDTFVAFFEALQAAGAEFGYRTANEMTTLVSYLMHFGMSETEAYDVAIMQKLLPKLHGSRSKLNKVLPRLIELCQDKYLISLEKLERMKKNAEDNGFASYAEA
jgi:5-methylcytosine-specific restriction protein B